MTTDNLAVQLYSLRAMPEPFDAVLARVAEAGYAGVETVGDHGLDAEAMKALLERHGLVVCSSHVSLEALEADLAGVCRFNLEIGNDVLVVPWLAPELRGDTADAWRALGARLGVLAERVRSEGLRLLYHNHDFEMASFGGLFALEHLFMGAGEAPLELELDLAWVVRGGGDPANLLARYRGRVPRVHLKDIAPPGENQDEGGWADLGHGTLEWPKLLDAAREAGAEWFVLEHDEPKDGVRFLRRSAEFWRSL